MRDFDGEIDDQIRNAKEKALLFSSSLQKTREQQQQFEAERQKWIQSYEEKSVLVEQLERELSSTVDALNEEKNLSHNQQNSFTHTGTKSQFFDDSKISIQHSFPSIDHHHHSYHQENHRKSDTKSDVKAFILDQNLSSRSFKPTESKSDIESSSHIRILELLQQSQNETSEARKEINSLLLEKDDNKHQMASLKRQFDILKDENMELTCTLKNTNMKLSLSNDQVFL